MCGDHVDRIVALTSLLLECNSRVHDDCLDQASLCQGVSSARSRLKARDYAEVLHLRQERYVAREVVRRNLPPVRRRVGLAEDRYISQLPLQV